MSLTRFLEWRLLWESLHQHKTIMFQNNFMLPIISLILLATCGSELFGNSNYADTELQNLVARTDDCPTACWEGIQVGKTHKSEVLKILDRRFGLEKFEVRDGLGDVIGQDLDELGLVFVMVGFASDSPDSSNPIVYSVYLAFRGDSFSVDGLVSKIGEPELVLVSGRIYSKDDIDCRDNELAYHEIGIDVRLRPIVPDDEDYFGVEPVQEVSSVQLRTLGAPAFYLPPYHGYTLEFEWDGYKDYCAEVWK